MYFEIDNTPEHIRRSRRAEAAPRDSPKEPTPRLVLGPFSRPPQVVFENVLIGTSCERELELFNPSKQVQQISLSRSLPPGLVIHLPEECLTLDPETCYCLTMSWTPMQPTALRETIHFTSQSRGRYDVIVILKSALSVTDKKQPKGFKTSPGKMKKKSSKKKSPVAIYKKKSEIIYNTTKIKKTVNVTQSTHYNVLKPSQKENLAFNDYGNYENIKCPFDSPSNINFTFDTSEIFSNMRKTTTIKTNMYDTFDKSCNNSIQVPDNMMKPTNKQLEDTVGDIFDNIIFTPLKTNQKTEKLEKGPKIIFSVNSESDFDDSLDMKTSNKENETHSIICVTSSQQNNYITENYQKNQQVEQYNYVETPKMQNKKIPNTSSPKELIISPNFSINTDFSRISELSFFPQRFSTERKMVPKEAPEIFEELNFKPNSDTYTKDSPNTPIEIQQMRYDVLKPANLARNPPKMCKQALFKDGQTRETYDRYLLYPPDHSVWPNDCRANLKSPPRSITPPLQSIPEESTQYSELFNRTEKPATTFTINRTFDKLPDRPSLSSNRRQTWSKKDVRAEPELWKVPTIVPRKSLKPKASLNTSNSKESMSGKLSISLSNKSLNQNTILNQVGNIYSQSSTVDPFLSMSYFYDEEAVHKFEKEFMRWLNYVLTPPADLDSNVEPHVDVGKAWLENRNKEVPAAPTREQVSCAYHNSHRLESVRRAARALFISPEIVQVFQKLNAQIEKKLIAIRTDRNLHLDVGLQKTIMELILCYNPLWLRIGLEAIYGLVLPLKSNSDIEGLTTFIVQRMFKNPHLKNKNSKSTAPNMLLPAYMEALKKFTLKKFFMLVFFLDQAKQRKLISHDPCLFCRNAICKESREIIIRFTRELIAGIGDITKHLRPLGFVVSHKQSYLDEYKYAVHNIALDIRDGVRLTKVMEIILIKKGLLNQLRTPPISRLQKIHNVQVALNALKEANFTIDGDISAQDIADGHREKTLSLLWQLIHVFRAPLFEKAANVIQTWWRKKFEVIVEKRKEEEKLQQKLNDAASVIQCWWRRIQYNRLVEWQMKQIVTATIVIQKFCKMWIERTRFQKLKTSVLRIEDWYRSVKLIREAKMHLQSLRLQVAREIQRQTAAKKIQDWVRAIQKRDECRQEFLKLQKSAVILQSTLRMFFQRQRFLSLKTATVTLQKHYRLRKLGMIERQRFLHQRNAVIKMQSVVRCLIERRRFLAIKSAVVTIQAAYRLKKQREEIGKRREAAAICIQKNIKRFLSQSRYQNYRKQVIFVQRLWKSKLARRLAIAREIRRQTAAKKIQAWVRAIQKRNECRREFLKLKKSVVILQSTLRMFIKRKRFLSLKTATVTLQKHYRLRKLGVIERQRFLHQRNAVIKMQSVVRCFIERRRFLAIKSAVVTIQAAYRLKKQREEITKRREAAAILIQKNVKRYLTHLRYQNYRNQVIKVQRIWKNKLVTRQIVAREIRRQTAATKIQVWYRSVKLIREAKIHLQSLRTQVALEIRRQTAAKNIQAWFRAIQRRDECRQEFLKLKKSVINLQSTFRMVIQRKRYLSLKTATLKIQKHYRLHKMRVIERRSYLHLRYCVIKIQSVVRCYIERKRFLAIKTAVLNTQKAFRLKKQREEIRKRREAAAICIQKTIRRFLCQSRYQNYRKQVINVQRLWKSKLERRRVVAREIQRQSAAKKIQDWVRAIQKRNECRQEFLKLKKSVVILQSTFRMFIQRKRFLSLKTATVTLQKHYRLRKLGMIERQRFLHQRNAVIKMQSVVRCFIEIRRFLAIKSAVVTIQRAYRLKKQREEIRKRREAAAICIQKNIRRYLIQSRYQNYRKQVINVQRLWKSKLVTRLIRCEFLQKRNIVIMLQSAIRGYLVRRFVQNKRKEIKSHKEAQNRIRAASVIQAFYRGYKVRCTQVDDIRVVKLRQRWRAGALKSTQESMRERNEEAMKVLRTVLLTLYDIETLIRAFRSLELLTEVYPMTYNNNAPSIVRRVIIYMLSVNRSIPSIEVLKSAAAVMVNLTRYRVTGPKIYSRHNIDTILKFMLRFSSSQQFFCILCTYVWLFSKYDGVREDLTEFLHMPENKKLLSTIKNNVERAKRMEINTRRSQFNASLTMGSARKARDNDYSVCSNMSVSSKGSGLLLPALEPDYGITRADKPKYFQEPVQAITCLLKKYNL